MTDVLAPYGASAVELADRTVLVTLTERAGGGDAASQGAACALALLQHFPDASFALSTGRGARTGQSIFGPVIEQAASLIQTASGAAGIFVDRATTSLLEGRYDFTPEAPLRLLGRKAAERPRRLLGKTMPCVGRDKDLAILEAVFEECASEPVARAVLVTAAPGMGKSRLRLELAARLERRNARVLTARGDVARSGSPLSLARQLVREAAGIGDTAPAQAQETRLRAWTAELFETDDVSRLSDFVCELAGCAVSEPGAHLRAARNDPVMMSSQLRWAFQSWIERETRGSPLIIALEDLHWGDAPSIEYLTAALQRLSDRALLLLGFARPEVEESFPRLWPQSQRIPLQPLTRRAAETLIRVALGDGVDAALLARLVERAGGNAFYLEELVRAAAEGDPETLPETVLATVELRLSRLDRAARRVLRAASLFGERFWDAAVATVLAEEAAPRDLPTWLSVLEDAELIQRESGSRFSAAGEYSFRHALVREAAYAMLTESDRRAGHLGAAEWLEGAHEKDALAIADHFELGGALERAVPWLVEGVAETVRAGDWHRVRSLVDRGLRCGAAGADLGRLRQVQGHLAIIHDGRFDRALELRREAMQLMPVASPLWLECAASRVIASVKAGRHDHIVETLQALTSRGVEPQPIGPYAQALCWLIFGLIQSGQRTLAESFLEQLERTAARDAPHDPVFEGYLCLARALDWFHDDPAANLRAASRGYACLDFEDSPFWFDGALYRGPALANVGHFEEALRLLGELERRATHPGFSVWARVWRAWSMVVAGRYEHVIETATPLVKETDAAAASQARLAIACARAPLGDLDEAERAAKEFPSERWPMTGITALTLRAYIRLAREDPKNALVLLDEARMRAENGCWAFESSRMRRLRALTLAELGDANGARDVIVEARDRLFRIAKSFDDPKTSDAWLAIPEHIETLRLAQRLTD